MTVIAEKRDELPFLKSVERVASYPVVESGYNCANFYYSKVKVRVWAFLLLIILLPLYLIGNQSLISIHSLSTSKKKGRLGGNWMFPDSWNISHQGQKLIKAETLLNYEYVEDYLLDRKIAENAATRKFGKCNSLKLT